MRFDLDGNVNRPTWSKGRIDLRLILAAHHPVDESQIRFHYDPRRNEHNCFDCSICSPELAGDRHNFDDNYI